MSLPLNAELERAKAYLQVADDTGATLYDHVAALVLKLIDEKPDPDTAIAELERLSLKLKRSGHVPARVREVAQQPVESPEHARLRLALERTAASIKNQLLQPETRAVAHEGEVQCRVQSVEELAALLNQAGVSLTRRPEDVLKLHLSVQRLVESQAAAEAARPKVAGQGDLTLSSARLWGVVRGTRRDYFVVEATRARYPIPPAKPAVINAEAIAAQKAERRAAKQALTDEKRRLQQLADEAEARGEEPPEVVTPRPPLGVLKQKRIKPIYDQREYPGQGANAYIYFVSNTLEADPPAEGADASTAWVQLPDLRHDLVSVARQMRRLVTGDLSAPVLGFPKFDGSEADYLRTQIARISASTLISPSGFYATVERDESLGAGAGEDVQAEEEYEAPPAEELLNPAGWVHHRSHLLRAGRTSVWELPEPDEEEEQQEEEEDEEEEEEEEEEQPVDGEQEEEEPDEPLGLLSSVEEDQSRGLRSLWSFRATPKPSNPHALVVARSLLWPGAVSVARKGQVACLYVGDGQKYLPFGFTPAPPPRVQAEYEPRWNPEEAEEGELPPLREQTDPLPPAKGEDDDEEGEDEDEEEEEEEEESDAGDDDE